MNPKQEHLLRDELEQLEKEEGHSAIFQILWGVIFAITVFVSWVFALILLVVLAIYYAITLARRSTRIKDLKFRLAGEEK